MKDEGINLPLTSNPDGRISGANGRPIAFMAATQDSQMSYEEKIAMAQLFVRAVNSYDDMIHALDLAYRTWAIGRPIPGVDLCAVIAQAVAKAEGRQ
jgi:hypothetical protein